MDITNKKVLVTGADGFIGSHLSEQLAKQGASVRALVQYNSFGSYGWLEDIPKELLQQIDVRLGDIRDPFFCQSLLENVHVVFHLAALIAIPYSYTAPASYVETNVNGTLNICNAAMKCGCEKVIHTSTSEVYGTAQYAPIDENHPLQPQSPYSASKIGADSIAMSFHNSFQLPLVIARPFNTYGPRQSARAVIPTIISQIASGKIEIKLGDTTPTRDFNYVEDTCRGIIALAQSDETVGHTVNIGSNFEISVGDTLELIKKKMNPDVRFLKDEARIRPANSEVFRLWCDNSKLCSITDFTPMYSLEKGLEKTIEWFCRPENLEKYKADIYNV
jgi:NAD dependent epimerase/dehydratase